MHFKDDIYFMIINYFLNSIIIVNLLIVELVLLMKAVMKKSIEKPKVNYRNNYLFNKKRNYSTDNDFSNKMQKKMKKNIKENEFSKDIEELKYIQKELTEEINQQFKHYTIKQIGKTEIDDKGFGKTEVHIMNSTHSSDLVCVFDKKISVKKVLEDKYVVMMSTIIKVDSEELQKGEIFKDDTRFSKKMTSKEREEISNRMIEIANNNKEDIINLDLEKGKFINNKTL
jgi:hypothetical protein